jgi:hypothetical protein
MSPPRVVDQTLLALEAAHFNWEAMMGSHPGLLSSEQFQRLVRRGRDRETALRWHVAGHRGNFTAASERGIGLPTGPFTVWRRESTIPRIGERVAFATVEWGTLGYRVGVLSRRLAAAELSVEADGPSVLFGLADPSDPLSIVTRSVVPAGTGIVWLHGPGLAGFIALANVEVNAVKGVTVDDYHTIRGWEPIELVGLPVDETEWADVGDHARPQGLVAGLESPRAAAAGRLDRGAPPIGWDAGVELGVAAPPWRRPASDALLDELDEHVLAPLRAALELRQDQQAATRYDVELPPPATLDGQVMAADPSTAQVSPIGLLQSSVSSDPFLSLALGYGTTIAERGSLPQITAYHPGSRYDYMVTAPYANGLDGRSEAVELVAYALRPTPVTFPPVAVQAAAEHLAHQAPPAADEPWSASAIVRWERPPPTTLFRVASYAAVRHDAGAVASRALMEERAGGGFRPIAPAISPDDAEANLVHLADPRLRIANDPGTRSLRYSVAPQNLFGLWSGWRGADHAVEQPPPVAPRIVSAALAPPELVVDFTWDWTNRRPATIELTGILYACAERGSDPPTVSPPATLDRTPGGGEPKVVLAFTGDTATVVGVVTTDLRYLNLAGDAEVPPGPAQSDTVRRYRLTIPGFAVDFAATPHVGLALWASGTERIPPRHATATTGPVVVFASDPVAPPMAFAASAPPTVPLGSLPDAEGVSHGRLAWPAVPGATGYYVYTADEFTLLAHHGLAEPAPDATLSERYRTLLDVFAADPDRRPFTRVSAQPVTDTSLEVALPRGSRAIHAYVVITAGAGSTEGPWPTIAEAATALAGLAAPRIAVPPPPELVATAEPAAGSVALALTTRPGHAVERVDVHRVRVPDAARRVETMGPPVASVPAAGGAGWTAETLADGRVRLRGVDAPGESWKRVWYRAVAWSQPDAERGLVRGASAPSNPFALIVPPAAAPDLSPLDVTWPGGALADARIDFASSAPLPPTPLGPHRIAVSVEDRGDPDNPVTVVDTDVPLDQVPDVEPAGGSGLWREPGASPPAYRVLVRRDASAPRLSGRVRIVDPLGRASEQLVDVGAGPVLPKPELRDVHVARIARGLLLTFTSPAPIVAPPAGPYMLRVVARLPRGGRPLAVELPLDGIPATRALPESADPLLVVRQTGVGRVSYAALAQVAVTRIDVTLRSPDGRTATATTGEVS